MRGMFRVKNVFAFLTMFHDFIFLEKRVLPLHRWTRKDRNWRQGLFLLVVTVVVVIFFFHVLFSIAIFWTTNILLFFFFFLSPFLRLFYLVQSQSTPRFSYHVFLFICSCKFVDFQITSALAFSSSSAYYFTHRTSIILWQIKKLCGCLNKYSFLPLIWHSTWKSVSDIFCSSWIHHCRVPYSNSQPTTCRFNRRNKVTVSQRYVCFPFTNFYSLLFLTALCLYIFLTFSIYKPPLQL